MGGLLDKANNYNDSVHDGDNVGTKVVNDPNAIIEAYEKGKQSGTDKSNSLLSKSGKSKDPEPVKAKTTKPENKKSSSLDSSAPSDEVPMIGDIPLPTLLNAVGWAIIVVGGLLSLQGGSFGIIVVAVVLTIGLGSIVQSQRMTGDISNVKTGISIALAVIIAAGPYAALLVIPSNASIAISEVTINEEDNEISFLVRGSFSEADAKVTSNGEELWSDSKKLGNDKARFYIPIGTIFDGNALDYTAAEIKEYTIKVTSSDGQTQTSVINPNMMTREVLNSAARITKVIDTDTDGTSSQTTTRGVTVEAIMGLFGPSESAQVNGTHSMTNLKLIPVASDYTVSMVVKGGNEYSMPTISVNGLQASWTSTFAGSQSGETNGWLGMPGTATNALNTEYLHKDDFYTDAGCYTFEITISNQYYGGSSTVTSESSWNLDWSDTDSKEDGPMDAC